MTYKLFITSPESAASGRPVWFKPTEVSSQFSDTEPTLNHAIKATRFYERMFGFVVKRELIA